MLVDNQVCDWGNFEALKQLQEVGPRLFCQRNEGQDQWNGEE